MVQPNLPETKLVRPPCLKTLARSTKPPLRLTAPRAPKPPHLTHAQRPPGCGRCIWELFVALGSSKAKVSFALSAEQEASLDRTLSVEYVEPLSVRTGSAVDSRRAQASQFWDKEALEMAIAAAGPPAVNAAVGEALREWLAMAACRALVRAGEAKAGEPGDPKLLVPAVATVAALLCDLRREKTAESVIKGVVSLLEDSGETSTGQLLLRCKHTLAAVQLRAGKPDKAQRKLAKVAAASEKSLGLSHPATLRFKTSLGIALRALGRHPEAVAVLDRVLAQQKAAADAAEAALERELEGSSSSSDDGGLTEGNQQKERRQPKPQASDARALSLRSLHDALRTEHALGVTFLEADEVEEALKHLKVAARRAELLAELTAGAEGSGATAGRSPAYLAYAHAHALALSRRGESRKKAARRLREVADGREAALGPTHADTAAALADLGSLTLDMGDAQQAEQLCKRALEARRDGLGEASVATLESRLALARVALARNATGEATAQLRSLHAAVNAKLGEHHPLALAVVHTLGDVAVQQAMSADAAGEERVKGLAAAEVLFQQAYEARAGVLGRAHRLTRASRERLDWCRDYIDREQAPAAAPKEAGSSEGGGGPEAAPRRVVTAAAAAPAATTAQAAPAPAVVKATAAAAPAAGATTGTAGAGRSGAEASLQAGLSLAANLRPSG